MSTQTSLNTGQLIDAIAKDGYAVIEHFLSAEQIAALGAEAKSLQQAGDLRPGGISITGWLPTRPDKPTH